ncbi:MAG: hypothetical protein AAB886_00420 [Patescibacteria group bacterium]
MSTTLEWGQQEGVAFVRIHHDGHTSRRFFSRQTATIALIDLMLDGDTYLRLKHEVRANEELEPNETVWDRLNL